MANLAISAILPGGFLGALGEGASLGASIVHGAANAALNSVAFGLADAAVSGDFDLGSILESAAFSAFTAGLTTGVNLSELGLGGLDFLDNDIISGFGESLSYGAVLEGVLDSALSSGASSLIYGSDFGDGFQRGVINSTTNLIAAAFQHEIGDLAQTRGGIFDEGGAGALDNPPRTGADGGGEAFHYTDKKWVNSIEQNGLRPGTFATPNGILSPNQAQIELALLPNRTLPNARIRIDLDAMRADGFSIPPVTRVRSVVSNDKTGRIYTQPGGGYELNFSYEIPPKYITVIKPKPKP